MRSSLIKISALALCFILAVVSYNVARYLGTSAGPVVLPSPSFTASSYVVAPGQEATLEWRVPGDLNVTIHGDEDVSDRFQVWQ